MNHAGQEYILNYHLNLNWTDHHGDDDHRQMKWTYNILYAVQSTALPWNDQFVYFAVWLCHGSSLNASLPCGQ